MWLGAGVGVLLSIAVAVLLAIFSQIAAGATEIIEGVTGLIAAAMLFMYPTGCTARPASTVGGATLTRVRACPGAATWIGLALLAMMAIFREGAETAVFYLGIAPDCAARPAVGIGAGVAVLAVAAWLILAAGVKLPLRLFFQVAGIRLLSRLKVCRHRHPRPVVAGAVPTTPIPVATGHSLLRHLPDRGIVAAPGNLGRRYRTLRCMVMSARQPDNRSTSLIRTQPPFQ